MEARLATLLTEQSQGAGMQAESLQQQAQKLTASAKALSAQLKPSSQTLAQLLGGAEDNGTGARLPRPHWTRTNSDIGICMRGGTGGRRANIGAWNAAAAAERELTTADAALERNQKPRPAGA